MRGTFIILSFFAVGILLGLSGRLPSWMNSSDLSSYALYPLIFLAGVGIGADRSSWQVIRSIKIKIFLIPAGILLGSLMGATLSWLFIPNLTLREVLSVASGFGYYSLSSVFISELHSNALGVVALVSNIIREVFTLLFTPLLVKHFGKLAAIASGGATSMDTTLPIISKYSGREFAVISVFSGAVLTILVPFLITFILTFAR